MPVGDVLIMLGHGWCKMPEDFLALLLWYAEVGHE
jgi:hypothetical protein